MNLEITQKLFYEDPHIVEFSATIISCTCDGPGGSCGVVLDRTAFFPEEGGQKADSGTLNGLPVLDVSIRDDIITHFIRAEEKDRFSPGDKVKGHVNWEQRFDFMQQHTGEHILSGLVHKHFGYHNVGFHLGYEEVTLDFDGVLSQDQLRIIEQEANLGVWADLPVQVSFPKRETLASLSYRSKIEIQGAVRIVEIPGYDMCACCAPHVDSTGQIGMIKITGVQSHRGGVRIHILCGGRALADYTAKQDVVSAVSVLLSAKPDAMAAAVERLKEESTGRRERINALQAELLEAHIAALPAPDAVNNVLLFEPRLDMIALREAVNRLTERYCGYCGIFSGDREEGYTYIIGSSAADCRTLMAALNEKLHAKGGGSPQMIQGNIAAARTDIEDFFHHLKDGSEAEKSSLEK